MTRIRQVALRALSACCGAPLERWNDGKLHCSSCSARQG